MRYLHTFYAAACFVVCSACTKEFLDAIPNKSLTVPTTVAELQAILNDDGVTNRGCPTGELMADNYFIDYSNWQAQDMPTQNMYTWAPDIFGVEGDGGWINSYNNIFLCNLVLDGLSKVVIDAKNSQVDFDLAKGCALFHRAYNMYSLAQLYCQPYKAATAATDMGIVIKTTPDLNTILPRSTNQQTYDMILSDLHAAKDLLPVYPDQTVRNRPTKTALFAVLSRIYLSMSDYPHAKEYADSCLKLYNVLLDYSTVNPSITRPFPNKNPEIIMEYFIQSTTLTSSVASHTTFIDTSLINTYAQNDLRRSLFFNVNNTSNGLYYFRGNYNGILSQCGGPAVDEVYLNRAECLARSGDVTGAMNDLNALLVKRWKPGTFVPLTAANAKDALDIVLLERRKELVFRYLRWSDLRRLNQDPQYAITLKRVLNGQTYSLPPNDNRYVMLIPFDEVTKSHITQNPR